SSNKETTATHHHEAAGAFDSLRCGARNRRSSPSLEYLLGIHPWRHRRAAAVLLCHRSSPEQEQETAI
ncbi:hypothetical protein PMAYCL1PPCAC_26504, partial [Pristionchus mayeri]